MVTAVSPPYTHLLETMKRYKAGAERPPNNEIVETPTAEIETVTPVSEGIQNADMRMIQMLVTAIKFAQEPTPITINNIHSSQAEYNQTSNTTDLESRQARPFIEVFGDMFNTFFSSGFNRVCFFGMCGMGMYVYWSYLDHKWHMAEVQRRIDSNFLLRMTQWLFSDAPVHPRGQFGVVPPHGRFFNFW